MPQTILAFLGVLLLTTLTINQRDSKMQAYRARVQSEVELLAHGVGIGTIEMIAAKPFDEATKGGNEVSGTGELTEYPFPDDGSPGVRDDVDDYHDEQLLRTFETEEDTTTFRVGVAIHYVNDSGQRVTNRTYNKEIEVTVNPYQTGSSGEFPAANTVTLKRPISYAPH